MKVYKYPIKNDGSITTIKGNFQTTFNCPNIFNFGRDPQGQLCLWAPVDEENDEREFTIRRWGTGHELSDSYHHIGTINDGPFVWHYFLELGNI